jgi:hypothetical protein
MSFIHDPYYDETPTHERIKPEQLVKIPYDFTQHGVSPLDEYIRLSPALDFLKNTGCLVTMLYSTHALFYCDCSRHLEKVKQTWSDSMAYFPLVMFEEHMMKQKRPKVAKVNKKPTKLKKLLDELHSDPDYKVSYRVTEEVDDDEGAENTAPESSPRQRAEDILKLIRSRQDKKKK